MLRRRSLALAAQPPSQAASPRAGGAARGVSLSRVGFFGGGAGAGARARGRAWAAPRAGSVRPGAGRGRSGGGRHSGGQGAALGREGADGARRCWSAESRRAGVGRAQRSLGWSRRRHRSPPQVSITGLWKAVRPRRGRTRARSDKAALSDSGGCTGRDRPPRAGAVRAPQRLARA